jgi:hypothetical protein
VTHPSLVPDYTGPQFVFDCRHLAQLVIIKDNCMRINTSTIGTDAYMPLFQQPTYVLIATVNGIVIVGVALVTPAHEIHESLGLFEC